MPKEGGEEVMMTGVGVTSSIGAIGGGVGLSGRGGRVGETG